MFQSVYSFTHNVPYFSVRMDNLDAEVVLDDLYELSVYELVSSLKECFIV